MVWLLALHIAALVFWCASLLFLPVLIRHHNIQSADPVLVRPRLEGESTGIPRFVFTRIATPAALLAIIAGTAIFMLGRTVEVWMLIKLCLVALLVVAHALMGWLLLTASAHSLQNKRLTWLSHTLAGTSAVLMIAIIWLVLAKPLQELLP